MSENFSTKDMEKILEKDDFHTIIASGAGMSRILKHIESKIPFMIISAFTFDYSKNVNSDIRTIELVNDIRKHGLGVIRMRGHWVDEPKKDEEDNIIEKGEDSYEISLFVNAYKRSGGVVENKETNTYSVKELQEIAEELAKKYNQTSYIFGDGEKIFEIFTNGRKKPRFLGNHIGIKEEVLEGPYSDIKGKKFVFSHIQLPKINNYIGAIGWASEGYVPCKLTKVEKENLVED